MSKPTTTATFDDNMDMVIRTKSASGAVVVLRIPAFLVTYLTKVTRDYFKSLARIGAIYAEIEANGFMVDELQYKRRTASDAVQTFLLRKDLAQFKIQPIHLD